MIQVRASISKDSQFNKKKKETDIAIPSVRKEVHPCLTISILKGVYNFPSVIFSYLNDSPTLITYMSRPH